MAAKDRWTSDLKCEGCGTIGKAHWSENDYPFMKRLDRQVNVDGLFSAKEVKPDQWEIKCNGCGVVVSR